MRVDDILRTKGTRIGMVRVNETVETALRLLRAEDTDGLVVKDVCRTEGNTVVGVLSEREVVRGLSERGAAVLGQPVTALMRRDPVFCRPDDPVRRVLQLMDEHAVRHVPVLDDSTLIGLIGVRDLIRLLALPNTAASREDAVQDEDTTSLGYVLRLMAGSCDEPQPA